MRALIYISCVYAAFIGPAMATPQSTVSTALVFAVDSSSAMTPEAMATQIEAHAAALRSRAFAERALANDRCIGLHYLEWSNDGNTRTILPWTVVCSAKRAGEAAGIIEQEAGRVRATSTDAISSLSTAIDAAHAAMKVMPFKAKRKIVSISAIAQQEDGDRLTESRDRSVKHGYTIDAIAVSSIGQQPASNVQTYLQRHVITGDGAVAMAPETLDAYPRLLLQKILLEVGERGGRRATHPSR